MELTASALRCSARGIERPGDEADAERRGLGRHGDARPGELLEAGALALLLLGLRAWRGGRLRAPRGRLGTRRSRLRTRRGRLRARRRRLRAWRLRARRRGAGLGGSLA